MERRYRPAPATESASETILGRRKSTSTSRGSPVSKPSMSANFLEALLAIVLGNVVYFVLLPHLPAIARHHRFQVDLGTIVDFWFCLVVYGIIRTARRWR